MKHRISLDTFYTGDRKLREWPKDLMTFLKLTNKKVGLKRVKSIEEPTESIVR